MLCQDCSKKPTCVELCPDAEKWVNQDHVSQREMTHPEWELDYLRVHIKAMPIVEVSSYNSEPTLCFPYLSEIQNKCLYLFYFEGLTYKQIAKSLSGGRKPATANRIKDSSVRYQLYKAKALIRKHLFRL